METPSSHWVTIFATLLILTSTLPLISIPATATTQDTIECHSPRPDIPIGHSWSVDEDDANVNATIRQINGSQIQYTYHDLEPSDAPYGPFFPTWMVDAGIRVDSAQGFDVHRRPNSISLTWNTSVTNPSFTLTTTRQRSAGVEDAGFAIQPEWAFVPYPNTAKTNYSLQTSQQGYTGDQFALLGRYDKYQREIGCHDIELIIPSALDTKESPSEIADSLETAGREIDAGWYYDTVRVFGVGPPVRRGGRAYNHEVWANVDASFEPEHVERGSLRYPPRNVLANTWLHEYVHTRQRWITNTTVELNASWLTEASATYYSIAETERQGRMIACNETAYWTRLNKSLTFGENSMELTERESYQSRSGDYTYGASVLAALDAKLREETNGERSLEDVLSQLNQQEQVTHASFRDTVVDVGGQQMGPWVDRYVAGGAVPPSPPAEKWDCRWDLLTQTQDGQALGIMFVFVLVNVGIVAAERIYNRDR